MSLLLDFLDQAAAARALLAAVERVTAAGDALTPVIGGSADTRTLTDAVLAALSH